MNLQILPLAITMMAGPQIMSAIVFITALKPLRLSAAFLAGVAIGSTVGLTITFTLATVLGNSISLGDPSHNGSMEHNPVSARRAARVSSHQEFRAPQDDRTPRGGWVLCKTPSPERPSGPDSYCSRCSHQTSSFW